MKREDLLALCENWAKRMFVALNPNKARVDWVIERLLANEERFGRRYCPCRAITGEEARDALIVCPCVYAMGEIELRGKCLCELFVRR